jgi:CDP-diacylglycerol--serine O-phosphatidyltransferase
VERAKNKLQQNLKSISFRKIAPNIVTMLALCAGVTAIRFTIQGNWEKAVFCIFLAALLDGLDGRIARFLKGSTKFGAELDSLSDFVSFGVAPAILLYQWSMNDFHKFGWFFCLLFIMAMAMRLARFNTMLESTPQPSYWQNFFVGVPAPAAAALATMPVLISIDWPEIAFVRSHAFCGIWMCIIAFLMVSRIPTFSAKKLKIPTYLFLPLLLVLVLFASFILSHPWTTLGIITFAYALSIPVSVIVFWKARAEAGKK